MGGGDVGGGGRCPVPLSCGTAHRRRRGTGWTVV